MCWIQWILDRLRMMEKHPCKLYLIKGSRERNHRLTHKWANEAFRLGHVAIEIKGKIYGFSGVDGCKGEVFVENELWDDLAKHASITIIDKDSNNQPLIWNGPVPKEGQTDFDYSMLAGDVCCVSGPFNCLSYVRNMGKLFTVPSVVSLQNFFM